MIRPLLTLALIAQAAAGAFAAPEETPTEAAPATAKPAAGESKAPAAPEGASADKPVEKVGKYALKNRSTFQVRDESRAPFWPIGWVKGLDAPTKVQATVAPPALDEKSFKVTSILLGNPALAVINGRAYSEGEFLRLPKTAGPLRVRVQRIADGMVMLQHDKQALNVPLFRPELEPKAQELEVLNEQR